MSDSDAGSDAGFSVEGRDWPAKVNYFDKQQTNKRANAANNAIGKVSDESLWP